MVENKKTKREKDIKSKLLAAIAMLLVSSIMMVSTTYAWFTLSTAPEVQGITTTIGANGNLEIALSPESGMGSEVGDANLQTGTDWGAKNLTWGNLVDMGYDGNAYGLDKLTLAPAQLFAEGADGSYTLGDNALATPSYGSDGRIAALNPRAYIAGKAAGDTSYSLTGDNTVYGVRAVGTSSGMSAQEANLKNSANAVGTYANAAISAASNSLAENGNALASMLVQHAEAGSGDSNNYAIHVPALKALTDDLAAVVPAIDEALRSALIAAASSIEDEAAFNLAVEALSDETKTIAELQTILTDAGATLPDAFATVVAARDAVNAKITQAVSDADALMKLVDTDGDGAVDTTTDADGNEVPNVNIGWSEAGAVLTALMNTDGDIKVSGYTISAIKEHMNDMDFLLGLATDCQIQLGAGSGVYYDIAAITGNIAAKTTATVTARGMTVTLKNVIIKTTVASTDSIPMLPVMKTYLTENVELPESDSTAVLDAYYGYVIDLMVRTNAAESNLLLQTAPAQRVYSDSANEATMGKGTTIVFTTTNQADVASINNLVKSIRVVFFDPTHDDLIFGLAKVTSVVISEEVTGTKSETVTAEDGTESTVEVDVITYTITGTIELCQMVASANGTGLYVAGDKLESQVLCALTQNIPQAISALVYLDGDDVTSADVLAEGNVVGKLNLQFASSAELKPMENSELRNGTNN